MNQLLLLIKESQNVNKQAETNSLSFPISKMPLQGYAAK